MLPQILGQAQEPVQNNTTKRSTPSPPFALHPRFSDGPLHTMLEAGMGGMTR